MENKDMLIKDIQIKFDEIDKKRQKGKKTYDPPKGQTSLNLYAGDCDLRKNNE